MGCDGGTIPRRDELVRLKKKPEQKDKASELSFRWQHCSISQEPLKKPIVGCSFGRLYNKDVVIEKLLDKTPMPECAAHIKGLKDIKDLTFTPNPAFVDSEEKGGSFVDRQTAPYICPITSVEMNGKFKFCFLWTCGCVYSEKSMKMFDDKVCIKCMKPFTTEDVIIMNAVNEDYELMELRRNIRFCARKGKKSKKVKMEQSTDKVIKQEPADEDEQSKKEVKTQEVNEQINKEPMDDLQKETKKEPKDDLQKETKEETIKKNGKRDVPCSSSSLKHKEKTEIVDPAYKKSKLSYSVSKDPQATEVYKSLFTTHKNAISHPKAHWVTFNPFYN